MATRARWILPVATLAAPAGIAFSALVPSQSYPTDLLASLAAPGIVLSLAAAIGWASRRRCRPALLALLIAFALVAIQSTTLPRAPRVHGPGLRVFLVNSRASSLRADDQLAVILAADAHAVALVEPSAALLDAIRGSADFGERFPHGHLPDRARGGFVALFTRDPPVESRENGRTLVLPSPAGREWILAAAHPRSPRTLATWREGNRRVRDLVDLANGRGERDLVILVDLNSTPTGARGRALAGAGLRPTKPFFRPQATWPAFIPWPARLAIDDAWTTPGVGVVSWSTVPIPGSDHLGVLVELNDR